MGAILSLFSGPPDVVIQGRRECEAMKAQMRLESMSSHLALLERNSADCEKAIMDATSRGESEAICPTGDWNHAFPIVNVMSMFSPEFSQHLEKNGYECEFYGPRNRSVRVQWASEKGTNK